MTVFDAQRSLIHWTNQELNWNLFWKKRKQKQKININPDLRHVNYMALRVWYSSDSRHSIVFFLFCSSLICLQLLWAKLSIDYINIVRKWNRYYDRGSGKEGMENQHFINLSSFEWNMLVIYMQGGRTLIWLTAKIKEGKISIHNIFY